MKKILLLVLIAFFSFTSSASHLMGGEITWKCIKSGSDVGMYEFTLKVYRDCSGISLGTFSQTISVWGHPTITSFTADFVLQQDVSPTCNPVNSGNPSLSCANGDPGAVEEYIYRSVAIALPGTPPATGWHFTWDNCCRNSAITNVLNPGSAGFTLRAVMYPYTPPGSTTALLADPCYDSSPDFKEQPKTILCTGFPFSYSHNASDDELDSLVYSWGEPLDDLTFGQPYSPPANPLPLSFSGGYSVNSPLPGLPTLDATTGEVSYNAIVAGYYVTCVKVSAYKCGQLVAEIFREVQVILLNCPPMPGGTVNNPPTVNEPFIDTSGGGATPSFETTVYAGQTVSFNISGLDGDLYNGVTPQSLTMEASGGQFATDFTNTLNCLNPPCATFNNGVVAPPFSSPGIVNGVFNWQTACSHIAAIGGCGNTSNVFTFLIKVYDDFCPASGIVFATIKVTVLPAPSSLSPDLRCVSVLGNGDATLTWNHLATAGPSSVYDIYHSSTANGPFSLLSSVAHPLNSYTHAGAGANIESQYYYINTYSACAASSPPSDTLKTIDLDVVAVNSGTQGDLSWNQIHTPELTTSFPNYSIFAIDASGAFQMVGQTLGSTFSFPAQTCNSYQGMYISLEDSSGCISASSIDGAILRDTISPLVPEILDVSVNSSGKSVINWISYSADIDLYIIYMKDNLGAWITIDTVFAPLTSYEYFNSNASNTFETFRVRALDSCANGSLTSIEHNSINLKAEFHACDHSIDLTWNEYINMSAGISHYTLFVTETTDSGAVIDTTEYFINERSFLLENLNDGSNYYLYLVAYDTDTLVMATSNQLNKPIDFGVRPGYNYIDYVSINHNDGFVELNCLVDNDAIIHHYDVFRSLRTGMDFKKVGEVDFKGTSTIHFTDKTVVTGLEFYQYRVYPVDTCGLLLVAPVVEVGAFSNDTSFAQTILLETAINLDYPAFPNLEDEFTNTLTFNEYDKWIGEVSEYRLYRSVNREPFNLLPIYSWDRLANPNEDLEYIDIVTEFNAGNGRFCYYIEAIEGNNSPYGSVLEGSFSNISCISQTPIIYVPTVFTPNGDEHNEIFLPVSNFVSEVGYSFTIFNRSGDKIFSTNDPNKGWDGTFRGGVVQNGNYVYYLQYVDGVGEITKKTDVITLLR